MRDKILIANFIKKKQKKNSLHFHKPNNFFVKINGFPQQNVLFIEFLHPKQVLKFADHNDSTYIL